VLTQLSMNLIHVAEMFYPCLSTCVCKIQNWMNV